MSNSLVQISLVVPTYGRPKGLKRLLISLQELGYMDRSSVEIIVADNNRDSKLRREVKDLCSSFEVRYVHESRPGKSYAVNRGALLARGEYLAFTDDDTIACQDDWLESMAKHFDELPELAYVSGNVVAANTYNQLAKTWEDKGGLSKGRERKYWSRDYLSSRRFMLKPWQFNKICAGANCMVKRDVFIGVGMYNILLEGEPPFNAGATIEIGYRIVKAGYELLYDPEVVILHEHPESSEDLLGKMFSYGLGDSGYQMSNFIGYRDYRCLWWSLIGHAGYTVKNKVLPRMVGKYPLPQKYILAGLAGNLIGGPRFLFFYMRRGRKLLRDYEKETAR